MTEHPVATEFPEKYEKKPKRGEGGGKGGEKTMRKGNVARIYCMTVQISAPGKINLPATKNVQSPVEWRGGGCACVCLQIPGLV